MSVETKTTKTRPILSPLNKILLGIAAVLLFVITAPFTVGPLLAVITHKLAIAAEALTPYPLLTWSLAGIFSALFIWVVANILIRVDDRPWRQEIGWGGLAMLLLALNLFFFGASGSTSALAAAFAAAGGMPGWLVMVSSGVLALLAILPFVCLVITAVGLVLSLVGNF